DEGHVGPQVLDALAVGDGDAEELGPELGRRLHGADADADVVDADDQVTKEALHAVSSRRLAMTSYWISLVPSKMRKTRASRQKRCAGYSREYPYPPKTCMASLVTCSTISAQNALAMPASRSQRLPVSFMRAAW